MPYISAGITSADVTAAVPTVGQIQTGLATAASITTLSNLITALGSVTGITGNTQNIPMGTGLIFPATTTLIAAATMTKNCPPAQAFFIGTVDNNDVGEVLILIQIMKGTAGIETTVGQAVILLPAAGTGHYNIPNSFLIPAGTRISIRAATSGSVAANTSVGFNVGQVA